MSVSATMRIAHRQRGGCLTAGLLVWLAVAPPVGAEDVTTLAGVTYRQVRVVHVEPDGIIWEHVNGVCKVDFTDLPEVLRQRYHYDAKQAAAYQAAQARVRQQTAKRQQQDQQIAAAWQAAHLQQTTAAFQGDAQPGTFVYHRHAIDTAAERLIGEQIEAKKSAQELLTRDDGTFWDRRLWAVPCLIAGGGYHPGVAFGSHVDLNAQEFQASLHSTGDDFFNPIYMTKSYNQDVDRAAAFARDQP